MRKRKLRPSFLLRCVTLGFCTGFAVAVFFIAGMGTITGSTLIAMLCLWFVGIEWGLLPDLIEHMLTQRAVNNNTGVVNSIWFVDEDEERRVEWEKHEDETSNNPTIG